MVLRGSTTAQEVDDKLKSDVDTFNKWFDSLKPKVNMLKVVPIEGYRLGCVATAPIKDKQLYLAVPFKAIMNARRVFDVPILGKTVRKLNELYDTEDVFHQLLFLLVHESADPKSFWRPYLDLLPKSFDNPVYWSDKELSQLQGTTVRDQATHESSALNAKFNQINSRVFEKFPKAFPPETFTRARYLWAHSILDSRAIWMNGERNLVPMLDMVNCGEGPDTTRVHRSDHKQTDEDPMGQCETRASWSFKKGDQVLENYGQPNNIYFKYHGFIIEGNSHDCVNIDVHGHVHCVGGKHGLPNNLLEHMQHFLESQEQDASHAAVIGAALHFVKEKLQAYPTTSEADAELLKDPKVTGRHRTAVAYRLEEKKLLGALLKRVEADREL